MAQKRISTKLEVVGDAKSDLEKIARAAEDTEDALDDTRSAAKKIADAMSDVAREAKSELEKTEAAADALGEALGPELAAKMGRGGLMAAVSDFERLGLTLDEVKAEADTLATGIRELDTVTSHLDGVRTANVRVGESFDDVSTRADNTRSVVANFAGNAAQELPGVTGAMGPLNMAIGQFAEYASEGNIKLRNFAMAGAGLAVAGIAVKGITDHFSKIAEMKAFDRERVEDFTEALLEADDAADAVRKTLEDAGKVEFTFGPFGVIDATKALANLGITVESFSKLVAGSEEELQAWAAEMEAAGVEADALAFITAAVEDQQGKLAKAQDAAAITAKVFGKNTEDAGRAMERAKRAADEHLDSIEANAEALRDAADAELERVDAMRAAADANFALADATDDYNDYLQEFDGRVTEAAGDQEELNRIYREGKDRATEIADATVRIAEETATASGKVVSATEKQDLWNRAMLEQATKAAPEARQAILEYIGQVNGIPPEKLTDIVALINEGKLAEAQTALDEVSAARDATVTAEAQTADAEKDLNYVARARTSSILAQIGFRPIDTSNIPSSVAAPKRAAGGPTWAGQAFEVTEGGNPELLREGGRTYLLPGGNGQVTPLEPMRMAAGAQAVESGSSRQEQLLEQILRALSGGSMTLVVEGEPITARIVKRERELVGALRAGRRA